MSITSVPLLDLKQQHAAIRADLDAAIARVMDSGHFIMGPDVVSLEQEVAALATVQHGIGMSSGTDALLAALMALDIKAGDEVITTPYSFFATAGVIARLGARPVFVDIEPDMYSITAEAIAAAITERTRAIIVVHLYGLMANLDDVMALASDRGIAIIEDAAQAIGAFDDVGRQAGSVGAMGCFSFFPSKNLGGIGDGGMTVTNDAELAQKLRLLRTHGSQPKYYHRIVGGNFRLDTIQAAVLRVKLQHLAAWTAGRRRNAAVYRDTFGRSAVAAQITLPVDHPGHIYNQFVIRTPMRDELRAHLAQAGIGTEVYYPVPLHLQECFRELGYRAGDLPHAERAASETLALPIYPELTTEHIQYVVDSIEAFFADRFEPSSESQLLSAGA